MSERHGGNEPRDSGLVPVAPNSRLTFGGFVLDLRKHALFHFSQRVHLTPKPIEVLETLVLRQGEVVSKEDLLRAIWKGEFVTDNVLVQAVGEIRRALEDDRDNPVFVQTVPREGYRFIAPVTVEQPQAAGRQTAAAPHDLRVVSERPASGGVVGRRSLLVRLRHTILAIMVLLTLLGSVYGVYRWRTSGVEWSQPGLIAHISGSPHSPSFSPDGSRIAYVNAVDGVDQIFVRELRQTASIQVTSGEIPAESPRWSPNDEQILFARGLDPSAPTYGRQSIWSVDTLGGPARLITDDGRNPAWSPDGATIVFERGSDIWTANADGGNQRPVGGVPASESLLAHRKPSFSPDGSWIAFFHPETGPKGDFWIIPAQGGTAKRLTFDVCQGSKPVWTRDGKWLLFASERNGVSALWRVPITGGKPLLVFSATGDDRDPDVSQDGRQIVFANTRIQFVLTLLDPATGGVRELAQHRSNITYPMFDPQGTRIAFFMQNRERRTDGLYTIGLNGDDLTPVTRAESDCTFPHWSGDGRHLYYYELSPSHSFRKIGIDGGRNSEVVAGWKWEVNYGARVDSQQKFIVYSEEHAALPVRTVIRDISTGKERVLAKALDDPRWSRDDRLILGTDYTAAKPVE